MFSKDIVFSVTSFFTFHNSKKGMYILVIMILGFILGDYFSKNIEDLLIRRQVKYFILFTFYSYLTNETNFFEQTLVKLFAIAFYDKFLRITDDEYMRSGIFMVTIYQLYLYAFYKYFKLQELLRTILCYIVADSSTYIFT